MSEAATPAVAAGNRVSTTRIVGAAAVALAASVVVQNAVFFVGPEAPTYATPLGTFHAPQRVRPRSGPAQVRQPSRTTELFELIENHLGKAFVKVQQAMQVQVHMMQPPSPSNP